MSEKVFIDTFAIVALVNRSDDFHETTNSIYESLLVSPVRLFTTDLVLYEVGNALGTSAFKAAVIEFIAHFRESPRARILFASKADFESALETYAKYRDKDWGLVDCASFNKMRQLGIERAFTQDKHFRQAGFEILL